MKIVTQLFAFIALGITSLGADTMYTLSDVSKVYPIVELRSKHVSKAFKESIIDSMNELLDELEIEHKGYDERAMALVVEDISLSNETIINVRLMIGEQVRRKGSEKTVFAITYQNMDKFLYLKESEVEDKLEDSLATLFNKFSEQYKEEQKKLNAIKLDDSDFAQQMNYETNYAKALARARVEKKPLMLVLVANFCPWCRKFENRVLVKEEINTMVHQDYIPVILNKEKDEFPKKFNMSFTPIVHFVDSITQQSYETIVGYNNREEFIYLLQKYHNKERTK